MKNGLFPGGTAGSIVRAEKLAVKKHFFGTGRRRAGGSAATKRGTAAERGNRAAFSSDVKKATKQRRGPHSNHAFRNPKQKSGTAGEDAACRLRLCNSSPSTGEIISFWAGSTAPRLRFAGVFGLFLGGLRHWETIGLGSGISGVLRSLSRSRSSRLIRL